MMLDGVDVFVRVVEAGGFSAAARQLGMPPTTVSAKIARLEERLGVTLIRRSTRKMNVTAAGQTYFQHCRDALAALSAGEGELRAASAEPSGVLRLTVPSDIAQTLLPPILERYLESYPKVSVDVIATNTQLDLLAEGIDLALRASPALKDSTLQSRKLGNARLRLFASPQYLETKGTPHTPAELDAHEVLVHSRFPARIELSGKDKEPFVISPSPRIRIDDMQSIRALAVRGVAIALLPEILGNTGEGALAPVLPAYGSVTGSLQFVFPGGRFTPVNVRAFIDLAVGMLAR
jgi:DNA-binding transcriptional LysR family regulator